LHCITSRYASRLPPPVSVNRRSGPTGNCERPLVWFPPPVSSLRSRPVRLSTLRAGDVALYNQQVRHHGSGGFRLSTQTSTPSPPSTIACPPPHA
jgi:hypothetical protein